MNSVALSDIFFNFFIVSLIDLTVGLPSVYAALKTLFVRAYLTKAFDVNTITNWRVVCNVKEILQGSTQ